MIQDKGAGAEAKATEIIKGNYHSKHCFFPLKVFDPV